MRWPAGLLAACCCSAVFALDVVVEVDATIVNDDLTLARLTALRRAKASAVEQESALLHSTTVSTATGVETRTALTPRGRALDARILAEHVVRGSLRLTAEVTLAEPGQAGSCKGRPLRKAVVTAFPLRHPEQIKYGQYTGWPQTTAEELARLLNGRGKLLSVAIAGQYPFATAETAPVAELKDGIPLPVHWARRERAQYVVAGIFRDFGTATQAMVIPERQIAIEAYIYDGISGELVARREFLRQLNFSWSIPANLIPGSKSFSETRLGQTYYELLDDIMQWAETGIDCLPFSARVIRVDGRKLYLDSGSDSGIEAGNEFVLTQAAAPLSTPAGETLAGERLAVAGVVVRQVHPRHSVAEITAKKNVPAVHVGDVLYSF